MLMTVKKIAKTMKTATVAFGIVLSFGSAAHAGGNFMDATKQTSQPIGHLEFCEKHKSECSRKASNTQAMHLDRKRWQQLLEVNSLVNQRITPITDAEYYKKEEFWAYPSQFGDCEDYVLLKQRELLSLGWSSSSLLITVVRRPDGDGHAVLTVRTDKGDFILDNLDGVITPWNETVYRFIKRQSVSNSGEWQQIEDKRDQVAAIKP